MDIRSFFGKASKPGKKKAAPAPAPNDASSSSNPGRSSGQTKASKKKNVSSRRHIDLDDDSTTDEDAVVHVQVPTKGDKKKNRKKQIVLDDDSSTDGDGVVTVERKRKSIPDKPVAPSAKKLKSPAASSPKQNRTEVSAKDFFANTVGDKTNSNTDEREKKSSVVNDAPLEVDRSRSDSSKEEPSKKRERPSLEAEKDTDPTEPEKTSASPVTPPSAAPTPAKNKKKRIKASPAPKKSAKTKEPLLQPTELTSFSTEEAIPECLKGHTFVFTGVLPNLAREAAQDYVKILGGRVTGAVSGRTQYLVVGDILEDGRPYTEGSKYKKAMELKVIVVKGEEQLYGLAKLYSDKARAENPSLEQVSAPGVSKVVTGNAPPNNKSADKIAPEKPKTSVPSNPYAKRSGGAVSNPYARKAAQSGVTASSTNPYAAAKSSASVSQTAPTLTAPTAGGLNALWADKYAPQITRDILGNQDSVRKLTAWLAKWETTFNNPRAQGKSFSAPGGPRKAALLSGPPGIGKTTTALLVAKESGRDTLEFNASDVRSKKGLSEGLGDVTGSQVLNFGASTSKKKGHPSKKRVIIMDEVDGMGAGDRSGMATLISMIKSSKVPIICICNDRQSQKVRSLVPYCLDLRYKRPVKTVIARRAVRIGEMEGMRVEMNAAEAIAESCGNDIRQVLNSLQMWANRKGSNDSMTYKDVKERQHSINKDAILRVSMFDATKLIVEGRRGLTDTNAKAEKDSLYNRSDAFFVDYGLMGLMVQQNYLRVMVGQYQEAKRTGDENKILGFLENMHDASSSMSDFAVAENAVRGGDQNWALLPTCGMLAVKTGYHAGGETGGFLPGFPEFAGWMGKNSTRGRKNRLLQELNHHMNYKVSGDSRELRLCYLPPMRERFLSLMTDKSGPKTTEVIQLMDEYGLDRDDVFENLDEFKMDPKAKTFAALDSKQKAAFTREYNRGSHKSQALVAEQGVGKTRKRKASPKDPDQVDPDAIDDDAALESSDDTDDKSDSEEILALFAKKGRGKKSTKTSTKTAKKRKSTGSRKKI